MDYPPDATETTVWMRTMEVDGLKIFYREAGRPDNPQLVLLHGFPASSHQYRNLIPALADRFHVVAPDYPGFGNSDMPDPAEYSYTFDRISEVMEAFLELAAIQTVYLHGHKQPELISPDNWNMDFRFLERPHARQVQMYLFYDYRNNVTLYPMRQEFLRTQQPQTIIFWGQDDIFFTRAGGEAYLQDLPEAEMHRLDSGHFAVEDCLDYIAANMHHFYDEKVSARPRVEAAAARGR